ncbi:HRDC domain protein [Pseudoramibacter alactolyticus ATCC 23263]|uniref:HRDC domain protein n=1 Tax=Pseudoramibacter alactolyticus ATCC 23263 TaxID=887929 RepID=E6MG90_9FIRM|nr:HRDC domain-containing protein [Pseudoramibacter alactolyticus]EFV01630.1 HRDC domain protein [Pseudoramibacter alactolyticus ATCC 23263]
MMHWTVGMVIFAVAVVVIVIVAVLVAGRRRASRTKAAAEVEAAESLFEEVEIMADQDNGPTDEERFLAGTVADVCGEEARLYRNIYVPTADGGTHVIHLMLRERSGIYVFKYLHVPDGWIVGEESARWWTHFKSPEDKNYFDNPMAEVDADIKALISFFPKTARQDYHGFVVISDNAEIRDVRTESANHVISLSDLPQTLRADLEGYSPVFSEGVDKMMARVLATMKNNVGLEQRLIKLKETMMVESEKARAMRRATDQATGRTRVYDPQNLVEEIDALSSEERRKPEDRFTRSELALRESLMLWRKRQAQRTRHSEVVILSDRGLDNIVKAKPSSIDQLLRVSGMDSEQISRYGEAILQMVDHTPI